MKATRRRRNCRIRSTASIRRAESSQLVLDDLSGPNGLCFSPDEIQALHRRRTRAAQPAGMGLRRHRAGQADEQAQAYRRRRTGRARWHQVRRRRQPLVRLGQQRQPGRGCIEARRRDGVQPAGQADRAHPPARALRQPLLRRPEEEPPFHGQQPFALFDLRRDTRGGVTDTGDTVDTVEVGGASHGERQLSRRRPCPAHDAPR